MFIIAGLGNPGPRYQMTRHNVGFETIDYLAALYRLTQFKSKHKALVSEGMMQGKKVMLVKPQTFMNNSGESLAEILGYYKAEPTQLIVIYDDIDLEPGKIRIRAKGGLGTHNGMRSIVSHLNTEDFPRVRIGIGKPDPQIDLADYVLGRFTPEERALVNEAIEKAALAVATMVCASVEVAMGKYNG
ncbi:MAG TPA: aminoacyl-tRNA hydrolase [Thermoclostridium caenicola]|uniref:aminoacyl-tRNA hydrolase n=1 Tax=Thermoclostridium caenicola TaxID=659425 RepID=UPI002BC7964E|nr:aminoacyl-tRNA hydrolase [Thermoclostridium caenicola]HOK42478.1 aminoacyl-tRNA hydrolase [Thermoclostridium caenicola]HOL84381.1 aminoacyl-tRNA hydrolase [Thermoclostridium caenicola]HPO77554.1 aminoacyl-tRNA hydrolase [Thermoclostridium caenicola]